MKLRFKTVLAILIFLPVLLNAAATIRVNKISFSTNDGVKIYGSFIKPGSPDKVTFVLLHGLGSSKEEWKHLQGILARKGYGVLAYDARGHGESNKVDDGNILNYNFFGDPTETDQWTNMIVDLNSVINFLISEKEIKRHKIGLIGASIGANVAMIYGASHYEVPVIVLLSPGLEYMGLKTLENIDPYKTKKVAIVAAAEDIYAFKSSAILYSIIKDNPKASFITTRRGHGVGMFNGRTENDIMNWIEGKKEEKK
ncbi:alpha/beta hydrolase [Elusimicrobiota bacterium]